MISGLAVPLSASFGGDETPCSKKSSFTPVSNTGCSGSALIDYLTITCKVFELPKRNHRDTGAANSYLDAVITASSFTAQDFEEKTFLGYRYSADIYAPDCEQPCGKIAVGGNADTCIISITGAGCPFLGDLEQLQYDLKNVKARITRIDLAHDDFQSDFITLEVCHRCACEGLFNPVKGAKPKLEFISDCGSGRGCTLYVGQRGTTQLCIYEKGKKEGDKKSLWVRIEVRLWSKNKTIPLDVLNNTYAYMLGAYPALHQFIQANPEAKRAKTVRNSLDASAEAQFRWLSNAAGRTLRLLQSSLSPGQFDAYISSIARDGLPRRFKSLPRQIVKKHTKMQADKLNAEQDVQPPSDKIDNQSLQALIQDHANHITLN